MANEERIAALVSELAPLLHDDGTGELRRIVERELQANPDATLADCALAVRHSREDAEIWLRETQRALEG